MSEFTKGPWHRSSHANGCIYVTHSDMRRNSGHFIASLSGKDEIANANLIAAAPDMYDALQSILNTWDGPLYKHEMAPNIDKARKTLAKARGEL